MKKRFYVISRDSDYVRRLRDCLKYNYGDYFVPSGKKDCEILFCQEGMEAFSCQHTFILCEEKSDEPNKLYIYQSVKDLVGEFLRKCSVSLVPVSPERKTRLSLLIAPGGAAELSTVSKLVAAEYGGREKVLYLDFAPFGDGKSESGDRGMSGILYDVYKRGVDCLSPERIKGSVLTRESYDEISAFLNPVHITELRGEFSCLVKWLLNSGMYERLVICLEELPGGIKELLEKADEIIIVRPSESFQKERTEGKLAEFRRFLEGLKESSNRMIKEREYSEA